MRFVLVRHGQSTNNLLWAETGADVGRAIDPRLTPTGEQQAAALAAYADRLPWRPTHLYASAMTRAIQTAAPLAEALDLPLRLHPDLFEVYGPYDHDESGARVPHPGAGRAELATLSPRLELPDWVREDGWWDGTVEAEREEIVARADRLLASLEAEHSPDDVVGLVSHGWFGNVVLARLLGIASLTGAFELANTAITLVEDPDEPTPWERTAVRVNWMPHLTPDLVTDSSLPG